MAEGINMYPNYRVRLIYTDGSKQLFAVQANSLLDAIERARNHPEAKQVVKSQVWSLGGSNGQHR